jgi:hypothetical protein
MRAAADRVVDDARSTGREVQVLDAVRMSQKFTLGAIRAWSDAAQSVMPSLPSTFPVRPDNPPKPEDVVANAYDFAEQLLATQRKFAEDVLRATAPPAAKAKPLSGANRRPRVGAAQRPGKSPSSFRPGRRPRRPGLSTLLARVAATGALSRLGCLSWAARYRGSTEILAGVLDRIL